MLNQLARRGIVAPLPASALAVVPTRFIEAVAGHVVHNGLFPLLAPLMLGIIGPAGTGKSWQVREIARQLAWNAVELNASALAGEREGIVVRVLHETYARACEGLKNYAQSFLLIDDFDLTLTSIRSHVETSQHTQLLISALMELCDRPERIRAQHPLRVPIILTTNSLDAVYQPLIRYGRMHVFHWAPTPAELAAILEPMFSGSPASVRQALAERFSDQGLAFFTELKSEVLKQLVVAAMKRNGAAGQTVVAEDIEKEFGGVPLAMFETIGIRIIDDRKHLTYLRS